MDQLSQTKAEVRLNGTETEVFDYKVQKHAQVISCKFETISSTQARKTKAKRS